MYRKAAREHPFQYYGDEVKDAQPPPARAELDGAPAASQPGHIDGDGVLRWDPALPAAADQTMYEELPFTQREFSWVSALPLPISL